MAIVSVTERRLRESCIKKLAKARIFSPEDIDLFTDFVVWSGYSASYAELAVGKIASAAVHGPGLLGKPINSLSDLLHSLGVLEASDKAKHATRAAILLLETFSAAQMVDGTLDIPALPPAAFFFPRKNMGGVRQFPPSSVSYLAESAEDIAILIEAILRRPHHHKRIEAFEGIMWSERTRWLQYPTDRPLNAELARYFSYYGNELGPDLDPVFYTMHYPEFDDDETGTDTIRQLHWYSWIFPAARIARRFVRVCEPAMPLIPIHTWSDHLPDGTLALSQHLLPAPDSLLREIVCSLGIHPRQLLQGLYFPPGERASARRFNDKPPRGWEQAPAMATNSSLAAVAGR